MSRQKRIVLPDTVYYVMTRGNERQNIYRDPDDRHKITRHRALTHDIDRKNANKI